MAAIAYPYTGPTRRSAGRQQPERHLRLVEAPGQVRRPAPARRAVSRRPVSRRAGLRRALPGVAVVAVLVGTWFGAGALTGQGPAHYARLAGSTPVAGGYAYVVRPGDTLWSIATRLDPAGDPQALVARLSTEVRGSTLVPGSVLVVP